MLLVSCYISEFSLSFKLYNSVFGEVESKQSAGLNSISFFEP